MIKKVIYSALTFFACALLLTSCATPLKEVSLRPESVKIISSPTFSWLAVQGARKYDLEIAVDSSFQKVVFSKSVVGTRYQLHESEKEKLLKMVNNMGGERARIWWRVRPVRSRDDKGKWSNSGTQVALSKPQFKNTMGKIYSSDPLFSWKPVKKAQFYELEISSDLSFSQDTTFLKKNPDQAEFQFKGSLLDKLPQSEEVENPKVYWRVRAVNGNVKSDWSEVSQPLVLAPPVFILPENKVFYTALPVIRWKEVDDGEGYEIQISHSKNFNRILEQAKDLKDSEYKIKNPEKELDIRKTYYFRVRAVAKKLKGEWAQEQATVKIDPPELTSPEENKYWYGFSPQYKWTKVRGASYYIFQVAPFQNFQEPVHEYKTSSPEEVSYTHSDPNFYGVGKKYFVRLKTVAENGQESKWSPIYKYYIKRYRPQLVRPSDGVGNLKALTPWFVWKYEDNKNQVWFQVRVTTREYKIRSLTQKEIPWQEWEKDGSHSWGLKWNAYRSKFEQEGKELPKRDQGKYVVFKPEINLKQQQKYFWRVRAFYPNAPEGQRFTDWSDIWEFTIGKEPRPAYPTTMITSDTGRGEWLPRVSYDGTKLIYVVRKRKSRNEGSSSGNLQQGEQFSKRLREINDRYSNRPITIMMKEIKSDGSLSKGETQVTTFSRSWNQDLDPFFSPDGREIYYATNRFYSKAQKVFRIVSRSIKSPRITLIKDETRAQLSQRAPCVSPKGRHIVFQVTDNRDKEDMIWTMDLNGNKATQFYEGRKPVFGPQGKYIYFESDRGQKWNIWRMKPDGTKLERITSASSQREYYSPAVSPDGTKLAMVGRSKGGNADIWIYLLEGPRAGTMIQVTTSLAEDEDPCWMPDSRTLIFVSTRDSDDRNLWKVNLKE